MGRLPDRALWVEWGVEAVAGHATMREALVEGVRTIGNQVDAITASSGQRLCYQGAGYAPATPAGFHGDERQVGLDLAVALEACEADHPGARLLGDDGGHPGGCHRTMRSLGVGGERRPALLLTQAYDPGQVGSLVDPNADGHHPHLRLLVGCKGAKGCGQLRAFPSGGGDAP